MKRIRFWTNKRMYQSEKLNSVKEENLCRDIEPTSRTFVKVVTILHDMPVFMQDQSLASAKYLHFLF